jgi:Flp pilus assembly protein TadD
MSSLDALYDEAISLMEAGDLEGAKAKLQALLEQDANYALAHSALGVICGRLGQDEEAVAHSQKVCELEPDDPFSFVALSLVCQKVGMLQEAEQASAQARRLEFGH